MLLTGLVISGGALYTGVRLYKKGRKGRKGERLIQVLQAGEESDNKATSRNFQINLLSPFLGERRDQQLQEISSDVTKREISDDEKANNRKLFLSLTLLGLTTGGMVYPVLSLLSIPGLVYLSLSFIQDGYNMLVKERRVGVAVVDAVFSISILLLRYFFADALFFVLLFLSEKLLLKTEDSSKASLINIFGEIPGFVWVQKGNVEVKTAFEKLQVGDIVVVSAGEIIPVDGTIADGIATIDQHMLTGESQPADKGEGDSVFASTTALAGKIYIRVEKTGSETVAAQIGEVLSRTVDFKSSVETRGEVIANKSALPMLAFSAFTLPILGPSSAVAVLNAYFAYNLRIISPISVLNFLQIASQKGILVKDGRAMESLSEVDTVVFDKTGTLTLQQPHVGHIYTWNDISEDMLLTYAAAAEYKQAHPIAKAILQEASTRQLPLPAIHEAKYEVGYGIKVKVDDQLIRVGSFRFMEMEGLAIPDESKEIQFYCHEHGHSIVYVAIDDQLGGAIELHATIRPEAKRVISDLRQRNMTLYIISGDHEKPTQQLAQELGIDHYFAETLPENKADLISQLQQAGKSVCFIGDGINDAIALKKANVSISLRGASTIATDTAQIILMDGRLNQLTQLFDLAENLDANMKGNLITSIIPGVLCIYGVYVMHVGIIATEILYNLGLIAGVTNAMLPRIHHRAIVAAPSNSQNQ